MIRRSRQAGRNKYPQLLIEQGVDVSQLIKGSRPGRKRVLNPVNFSGVGTRNRGVVIHADQIEHLSGLSVQLYLINPRRRCT